ncbi:hypothetical protein [Ornithinimicrobium cryptoxanthini]|uniref:EspG family protein n=1 Tax=Ornithinimicrobium cryptoxanthini TaxID=2934161 RepID=A0ABY4YF61_9MICO|nr:hypothetical protein [Ornithinimicrobium cryptoxanthini]USQ75171.1 hypothetical protein NF557_11060 [Ornithinimicrobium cryptoxanthini]
MAAAESRAAIPLRPALTVTEEELLVLTHGDLGVVPPRIELPADTDQRDLALSVATRSLMARGLVTPEPPEGSRPYPSELADAAAWVASEPLGLTLCLRSLAPCVLALQRVLGPYPGGAADPSVATRYLHLHPGIAVLEDVTDHGMHSLLTIEREHWERAVADFIVPPDAEPGTGPVRVLGTGEGAVSELLADLGHPTVLVEAAALLPDGVRSRMVALGPGGTFVSEDSQAYRPTALREMITELLQQTEAALSEESATMGE